jgi:hypothetical protein
MRSPLQCRNIVGNKLTATNIAVTIPALLENPTDSNISWNLIAMLIARLYINTEAQLTRKAQ